MTDEKLLNKLAYKNMIDFLKSINYTCETTTEQFYKNKNVELRCSKGHYLCWKKQSFNNKRDKYKKKQIVFCCSKCKKFDEFNIQKEKRIEVIQILIKPYNHTFLELDSDLKRIKFICGICGENGKTNFQTISREDYTGACIKCSNYKNRKSIESIKRDLNNMGL